MVHYLIASFSPYGNSSQHIQNSFIEKYVYKLNLQLHSKYISGNVKALDHQKRPQIEMFHAFGSLVSWKNRHTKRTLDNAVKTEMKMEVRQTKMN